MMRYLLDTNIIVSAFRSRNGASYRLVRMALMGDLPLVMHHKLVSEYRDVLSRPENLANTPFSPIEFERVLARLVADADEVGVRYLWRPNLKDASDNFVLEIAIAAFPCTIVTHNVRDFSFDELRFPHVDICTPGQLLQLLTH